MELAELQQGSAEWLAARASRITASDFGAALGHNKYKSATALLREKIFPTPSPPARNGPMRWGTCMEDVACSLYEVLHTQVKRTPGFVVRHAGLLVPAAPLDVVGLSPDGLITYTGDDGRPVHGLLEIKCPCSPVTDAPIRQYYYDQVQGIAQFMRSLPPHLRTKYPPPTFIDFVQYSPCNDTLQITRYPVDSIYGAKLQDGILRFGRELRLQLKRKLDGIVTERAQLRYKP